MKISEEGLELIKKFEGCELEAYRCSANVLTIGYGHTKGVEEDQVITQEEADEMLASELDEYEGYINEMVECDLDQHQFDALVAWVYNLGPTALRNSTLLKKLNWFSLGSDEKDFEDVPNQIKRWNKAGGKVLTGLVRRREAEARLFLKDEGWRDV